MRLGHGYDVHKLVEDRDLILGGVKIPFEKGLLGHSDADVLLHAVSDALLGAAGLRDIGYHFPDTDPRYKGIDSRELLRHTAKLVAEKGWQLLSDLQTAEGFVAAEAVFLLADGRVWVSDGLKDSFALTSDAYRVDQP